jgi:hypothetical protein
MKLLFLDFDGCLNSVQSDVYFWWKTKDRKSYVPGFEELCPVASSNLNHLLEEIPELRIVISSSWRKFFPLEDFEPKMKYAVPAIEGRIIGQTPRLLPAKMSMAFPPRGHEIYKWLEDNNHLQTPFIVVDDDRDMDKVEKNFIWVDNEIGLTWKHVKEIRRRFMDVDYEQKSGGSDGVSSRIGRDGTGIEGISGTEAVET